MCGLSTNNFFNILENTGDKDIFDLLTKSGVSYAHLDA